MCIKPINTECLLGKSISPNEKNNLLNETGKALINKLIQHPNIDTFLDLSNVFARECGLLDSFCREPFLSLNSIGIKSGVALFGHTLFTIVEQETVPKVTRALKQFDGTLLCCHIDDHGARMIEDKSKRLKTMIPKNHPRYCSLMIREKLVDGFENGLVAREGLIAHGRGESFDYLLGERTTESALNSINAASALFVLAEYPVLSVNGNTAALCGKEICELNGSLERSSIEINLFYRTEKEKN